MTVRGDRLTLIFGPQADNSSPEAAARTSKRLFVRGTTQLALFDEHRQATGHKITAWEALQSYGLEVLDEAAEYGSAILTRAPGAVRNALGSRRKELGLDRSDVARRVNISEKGLAQIESNPREQPAIADLEHIAFVLGLDETQLGFSTGAGSDPGIAARLKTLRKEQGAPGVSPLRGRSVIAFAEAASIVRVQLRMQEWLGLPRKAAEFKASGNYGSATNPAWQIGYQLAETTRVSLGLGDEAIPSMRTLTEEVLGIPVIQAELPSRIAGATIGTRYSANEVRGVVLNVSGANENPWVRRATLAHELGHLLYDPEQYLEAVRVDSYQNLESSPWGSGLDFVEQRANAFAIAFLAPPDQVREMTRTPLLHEDLESVMQYFGISYTAARYHVVNAHYRTFDAPEVHTNMPPADEWAGRENFTIDYFPLKNTPLIRRGRFAGLVIACLDHGLISLATAAGYLDCTDEELQEYRSTLRSLYPIKV